MPTSFAPRLPGTLMWILILAAGPMLQAGEAIPPASPVTTNPVSVTALKTTASAPLETPAAKGPEDPVFGLTRLHQIRVEMPAAEWTVLQTESTNRSSFRGFTSTENDFVRPDGRIVHFGGGFGGYYPWVHADVAFNGKLIRNTGLRYKGNGSYSAEAGLHRNIKVKTDLFGTTADWEGLETINLNAGSRDPARMRESLAFAVFRAAGVPAARTAYAEVSFTVPGSHANANAGLYTVIENVNKRFLRTALPPGTGLLMKPEGMGNGLAYLGSDWAQYVPIYRPEREATADERKRVIEFAALVNQPSVPEFRARIGDYIDIDAFLRFLAATALISHRDSYLGGNHNFFIYLDPRDGKFRFIPWDVDTSFSQGGGGRGGGGLASLMQPWGTRDNPLGYYLLDDPKNAVRYRKIVREIVDKVFNPVELKRLLDAIEPVVREPLQRESEAMARRGEYLRPNNGSPNLRSYLLTRLAEVQNEMATWPADP